MWSRQAIINFLLILITSADARFGEVRADGPPASDGKPKEATDAPAATAAPPPAGTA